MRFAARALAVLPPTLLSGALAVGACSAPRPPPLGDDAGRFDAGVDWDALAARPPIDASVDARDESDDGGTAVAVDYFGQCPAGRGVVWRYHDFQTKTPADSSIAFHARTASSPEGLATAPKVPFATVTGPDITVWAGVDLEPKLVAAGQSPKLAYLRVVAVLRNASDGTAPTLVARRQLFDCVVNQ
jgi:hypothetical protein